MKKHYFLFLVLLMFLTGMGKLSAQTDVTTTYLSNADFNTAPVCYTVAGGTTLTSGVTRIGTTGWIFVIPGWTNASTINNNAVQVATGEYGTVANAQGFNNVAVPATNINGVADGAAISMSAAWGDKANYYQDVTLPAGRYKMKIEAINRNTATAAVANFCGFIPASGTASYMSKKSFPNGTWVRDSVTFYLTTETVGKINIGMTTSSNGSANGAKLFLDNVKLLYYGIDKTDLKLLIDSANVMIAHPQNVGTSTVYSSLSTAVAAAQAVYDNTSATATDVVAQQDALKAAIANVYNAITLQSRIETWTTFPYNATSAITNADFESDISIGWTTNVGPIVRQSNTSFTKKSGTNYAERWISNGSALSNLKISQVISNIPNGIYIVTAAAHAIQQSDNTYPGGAYVYANNDSTQVFAVNDYAVQVTVTNHTLELGFKVLSTGNWIAMDNFRLSYISDGSPYFVLTPDVLNFTPNSTMKVLNVKGGNLTTDVTLTPTSNFTLSRSSVTAAEAMAEGGINVEVTSMATNAVSGDSLVLTSGTARGKISLNQAETAIGVSNYGLFYDQSMANEYALTISGDLFNDIQLSAPNGVVLSANTITKAEAAAGKAITVTWDHSSKIINKYIHLVSGVQNDSVLVFAAADNLISNWDGDNAEGEGSKLSDFGWTQTDATGVATATVFNNFAATGVRYVTIANAADTYKGKPLLGHRVAYLRTWGSPVSNVYNLEIATLEANTTYIFRGLSAWHNNETNPTFTYAINTAKSNLGDTLGIQSVACTVRQQAENYEFEFTPVYNGLHYLTVSSNTVNDAMCAPEYLAITPKPLSTGLNQQNTSIRVYPTITQNDVYVTGEKAVVRVFDATGKLIQSIVKNASVEKITLPNAGLYFIRVENKGDVKTVKVIRY